MTDYIDDIIQSYIDDELSEPASVVEKIVPQISPKPTIMTQISNIIPGIPNMPLFNSPKSTKIEEDESDSEDDSRDGQEDSSESESEEKVVIDKNEGFSEGGNQLERIERLERSLREMSKLQSEVVSLRSEISSLKQESKKSVAVVNNKVNNSLQYVPYKQTVVVDKKAGFDFIPSFLQKYDEKNVIPTYCGRPIEDHRRFTADVCGKSGGCLRCNMDNLVRAGYSISQLNEVRKQIIKLQVK